MQINVCFVLLVLLHSMAVNKTHLLVNQRRVQLCWFHILTFMPVNIMHLFYEQRKLRLLWYLLLHQRKKETLVMKSNKQVFIAVPSEQKNVWLFFYFGFSNSFCLPKCHSTRHICSKDKVKFVLSDSFCCLPCLLAWHTCATCHGCLFIPIPLASLIFF